jgi:hypothetical protein
MFVVGKCLAMEAQMTDRCLPQDGDLVIREDRSDGAVAYILHTAPGADQIVIRTRDGALARARIFAQQHGVRVWLTDGDDQLTLIEDFRESRV